MCAMADLRRGPKTSGTHRDSASSLTIVYRDTQYVIHVSFRREQRLFAAFPGCVQSRSEILASEERSTVANSGGLGTRWT